MGSIHYLPPNQSQFNIKTCHITDRKSLYNIPSLNRGRYCPEDGS